jgi:hypothetical protein
MNPFRALADWLRAIRIKAANKKTYRRRLMSALKHGRLTPEVIGQLANLKTELGLTTQDTRGFRVKAYLVAYGAATRGGLMAAEQELSLEEVQAFLGVSDGEITRAKEELRRLHLLRDIRDGKVPTISVPGLVCQKQEAAYWCEPASLLEERVIDRQYVGGSQGLSFRIAKGVSYRVGSQRGHLVSKTGIVPVSSGEMIITNKRVIFRGDRKAFSDRLDKLLDVHLHVDGIRITDGSAKPRVLKFSTAGNAEVVGAILSYAINNFTG